MSGVRGETCAGPGPGSMFRSGGTGGENHANREREIT